MVGITSGILTVNPDDQALHNYIIVQHVASRWVISNSNSHRSYFTDIKI